MFRNLKRSERKIGKLTWSLKFTLRFSYVSTVAKDIFLLA
jgi:hypothetical protein